MRKCDVKMKKKTPAGRPPKFNEQSTPVTVTLPRRVLQTLETIDRDRARAIVHCVEGVACRARPDVQELGTIKTFNGSELIVVPPCESLKKIPGLKLIEISPLRCLLAIPSGTSTESLEISLIDLLEHLPKEAIGERRILTALRQKIGQHRRNEQISKGEILYIDTR